MTETMTWYDADGNATNLTDMVNYIATRGMKGDGAPNYARKERVVPQQPGSLLDQVRIDNRAVDVPIYMEDTDNDALMTRLRGLILALDATRGDGRLRIDRDGAARELTCRYTTGLQNRSNGTAANTRWLKAIMSFKAVDPFWYATTPSVATYTLGTVATFFPFFPLRLTGGAVFADTTVNNPGDAEAWPVWTITGPGTYLSLVNATSARGLYLTHTLYAGETVVIDTRPLHKTLMTGAGDSVFGSQSNASALWPLLKGNNAMQIELTGATADSRVDLSFYPRYLSA